MAVSLTLTDSEGRHWDFSGVNPIGSRFPSQTGQGVLSGTNDAYDGGLALAVGTDFVNSTGTLVNPAIGSLDENGRELNTLPVHIGGVAVGRSVLVSDADISAIGFARFLDSFTNTTDQPITIMVQIISDLGSDSATAVVADTSGNGIIDTADFGFVTDEVANLTDRDSSVGFVYGDGIGQRASAAGRSFVGTEGVDEVTVQFQLTLQPGETQRLLSFAFQNATAAQGVTDLNQFNDNLAVLSGRGLLAGIGEVERAQIVNYSEPATPSGRTVTDGSGQVWMIEDASGSISSPNLLSLTGTRLDSNDSVLSNFTVVDSIKESENGQEVTIVYSSRGAPFNDATVSHSLMASPDSGFARYLVTITADPQSALDLSGERIGLFATMGLNALSGARDGNAGTISAVLDILDNGAVFDDSASGAGGTRPALTVVWGDFSAGGPVDGEDAVQFGQSVLQAVNDDLVIAAGGSVSFLFFFATNADAGLGFGDLATLSRPSFRELAGLSADEVANIANFQLDETDRLETVQGFGAGDDNHLGNYWGERIEGQGGNDVLAGNGSDDEIFGGSGNDTLDGGTGGDLLDGGIGTDVLEGGEGNDTYVVDSTDDFIFELSNDGIDRVLALASFTLGANVENLTLIGATSIKGTGNTLANILTGNTANNVLNGGAGNDTLNGGAGNDTLNGDAGLDTASYADATAGVRVNIALTAAQVTGGAGTDVLRQIENLAGSAFHDVLTGSAAANRIDGGAGNDTITGGAGADNLQGGAGDDLFVIGRFADIAGGEVIFGDIGTDELRFTGASAGTLVLSSLMNVDRIVIGTGTAATAVSTGTTAINVDASGVGRGFNIIGNAGSNILIGGIGSDTMNGTTNTLDGGAGNDTLIAGFGDDFLFGGVGNDVLSGGSFHDVLNGGAGNDTLIGGAGNDTVIGGAGVDMVSYAAATGNLTLSLGTTGATLTAAGFGTDNFSEIEGLEGGTGNDALTGDGLANLLLGGAGDDTLNGGLGNDTLNGGAGVDTASYAEAAAAAQVTGGAGTDVVSQVENLTGSAHNDILTGNAAANRIEGGNGNDTITGNAGADNLRGGVGDDLFMIASFAEHAAGEVIFGDIGIDELRFTGAVAGTLVLTSGVNVERIVVGTGTGAAAISTAAGAINVDGSALAQSVTIIGNAGANRLTGSALADTLIGGLGKDTLIGGAGVDVLTGGAGADQFVFNTLPNAAINRDTITDFTSGTDKISLAQAVMGGLGAAGALSADALRAGAGVTAAQDATDRIIHNTTTGAVFFDADGQGGAAAIQILQLTPLATLLATDILIF